jgi:hypothetical protein
MTKTCINCSKDFDKLHQVDMRFRGNHNSKNSCYNLALKEKII